MPPKRLLWQLFPSYLLITLVALVVVSLYIADCVHQFYKRHLAENLQAQAHLMIDDIAPYLAKNDYQSLETWSKSHGSAISTRITVVLPTGKVVADSEQDPNAMDDHSDRPEVAAVLSGSQRGESTRFSYTLHEDMLYTATPLLINGKPVGVLRLSVPVVAISESLRGLFFKIFLIGLTVFVVAAGLNWAISRRVVRPLEEIRRGAERFARGELNWRLPVGKTQEMAALAEGLNSMAQQLGDRMHSLVRQRNEQEAVLSSMVEGVFAVDIEERLISINHAGAQLLGVKADQVQGLSIQEVIRNTDLQEFVAKALASSDPVEGDIVLHDEGDRFLQANGTILTDGSGTSIGAVIVLNDITRLKRLETVRRDFVANVSHELKTPITSIKGFIETLLDGAMNDPQDARRFLEIVARQTDRLNAIIEDILTLSRAEDPEGRDGIKMEKHRVSEVLNSAVQLCQLKARSRHIIIEIAGDQTMEAPMNPPLLEQALVNLIDNAIKYSEPGQTVRVEAEYSNGEIAIRVHDRGCGIEHDHLPRIFERFYRVDKARSRKLGGTGLGLAIVKHIALVHTGSVSVESTPGRGSTFTLRLPGK